MTVNDFVLQAVEQIRSGIHSFNKRDPHYSAFMPKEIHFELMVYGKDSDLLIVNENDQYPRDTHRIKFSIDVFPDGFNKK